MRRHLADLDPTKIPRRYRRWLVAIGYASGVCTAREWAGRVLAKSYLELAVFFAFNDVERAVAL